MGFFDIFKSKPKQEKTPEEKRAEFKQNVAELEKKAHESRAQFVIDQSKKRLAAEKAAKQQAEREEKARIEKIKQAERAKAEAVRLKRERAESKIRRAAERKAAAAARKATAAARRHATTKIRRKTIRKSRAKVAVTKIAPAKAIKIIYKEPGKKTYNVLDEKGQHTSRKKPRNAILAEDRIEAFKLFPQFNRGLRITPRFRRLR